MDNSGNIGIGKSMSKAYTKILDHIEDFLKSGDDSTRLYLAVCKVLQSSFDHYNWVGIYVVEGDDLVLKAWEGQKATEHTRIPVGDGICGLAARTAEVVIVPDVSKEPRYLECFPGTRAEIVVPIKYIDDVFGEIDIDSNVLDPFTDEDSRFLRMVADQLAAIVKKLRT